MSNRYELTGGTKDVNPQHMSMLVLKDTTADIAWSTEVALPVQRLNNRNRSMVMEVLKIEYYCKGTGETTHHWIMGIATTKLPGSGAPAPSLLNGAIFHMTVRKQAAMDDEPFVVYDLTDGAGHGRLIAADKIYPFAQSSESDAATVEIRLIYRWKNVSLTEYIGLVQASQV